MAIEHSPIGTAVRPYVFTNLDHQAIGRLIRACAELEDVIGHYLSQLSDMPLGMLIVMLGRSSISSKLQIAQQLAYAKGAEAKAVYDECFGAEEYADVIRCRNTVAHGMLLGLTDEGGIAFQVNEHLGIEGAKLQVAVYAYTPHDLVLFADMAEGVVPQIELKLGLQALRGKRRAEPLGPRAGIVRRRRGRKRRQKA